MEPKKWYQSKTIWIAILTGLAGIFAAIETQYPTLGVFAVANSLIQISLRFITSTPIE